MYGRWLACSDQLCAHLQARVALVNQHHADQIDLDDTPLEFLLHKFPGEGTYDHEQVLVACCMLALGLALFQSSYKSRCVGGSVLCFNPRTSQGALGAQFFIQKLQHIVRPLQLTYTIASLP